MAFGFGSSLDEPLRGTFLVPDYYKTFSCKGQDCRQTCCSGWKVTLSMPEYFALHGLACEPGLRDKIDRAFKPLDQPIKERYAEIRHNPDGRCPLLDASGWCTLHQSCGEAVLPSVCRYYPRGPRKDYAFESACANSCEKTLELLFETTNPVGFETRNLIFKMPFRKTNRSEADKALYQEVRPRIFNLLSDRSVALPTRIQRIGRLLMALDAPIRPDLDAIDMEISRVELDLEFAYGNILSLSEWFSANNPSLAPACISVEALYKNKEKQRVYDRAFSHFEKVVPDHAIYFEKMLVNNLFFKQFPFQEYTNNFTDEFIALCGMYIFLRYLAIHLMRNKKTLEDFVDIMAKTFRVITHTQFERNIMILLKHEDLADPQTLAKLLQA